MDWVTLWITAVITLGENRFNAPQNRPRLAVYPPPVPKNHWDWAFFENAGGAFVPHCVIQRISAYMTQTQVQPGYPYPESIDAADRMNLGHKLMAEFVGADIDEITVSASTILTSTFWHKHFGIFGRRTTK